MKKLKTVLVTGLAALMLLVGCAFLQTKTETSCDRETYIPALSKNRIGFCLNQKIYSVDDPDETGSWFWVLGEYIDHKNYPNQVIIFFDRSLNCEPDNAVLYEKDKEGVYHFITGSLAVKTINEMKKDGTYKNIVWGTCPSKK